MYPMMSRANNDSFPSSFPIWVWLSLSLFFFNCVITIARTSWTFLNRTNGQPFGQLVTVYILVLFLVFEGKLLVFSPLSMIWAVGLDVFYEPACMRRSRN